MNDVIVMAMLAAFFLLTALCVRLLE